MKKRKRNSSDIPAPWSRTLMIGAFVVFFISLAWLFVEPGFEPAITGIASFLGILVYFGLQNSRYQKYLDQLVASVMLGLAVSVVAILISFGGLPLRTDTDASNPINIGATYLLGSVNRDPYYLAIIVNIKNLSSEDISIDGSDLEINGKIARTELATFSDTFIGAGKTQNIVFLLFNIDQDTELMNELSVTRDDLDEYRRTHPLPTSTEETMSDFQLPKPVKFSILLHYSNGQIDDTQTLNSLGVLPIWIMDWINR